MKVRTSPLPPSGPKPHPQQLSMTHPEAGEEECWTTFTPLVPSFSGSAPDPPLKLKGQSGLVLMKLVEHPEQGQGVILTNARSLHDAAIPPTLRPKQQAMLGGRLKYQCQVGGCTH